MKCACCGYEVEDDYHKIYGSNRYVCERCWSNPVLFFNSKFPQFPMVSKRFIWFSGDPVVAEVMHVSTEKSIEKYTMNVAGKTIEAHLEWVPLEKIKLDPNNVRFKHIARKLSDEDIMNIIWTEYDTQDLYKDIKFAHGLLEKPVLYHDYRVCEGNRRIVCLRKLTEQINNNKEKVIKLKEVDPVLCVVLPEGVDDSLTALYLAGIHVTGKVEWDTLNKAAHIYDLVYVYDYNVDDLTKALEMGKKTIYNHIRAYELTTQYGKKYGGEESERTTWLLRFSHFYELIKRRDISDWHKDPKNIELFMEWLFKNKIGRAENVRNKLSRIIKSHEEYPEGYKALLNGAAVDEAYQIMQRSAQTGLGASMYENFDKDLDMWITLVKDIPKSKMVDMANDSVRYLRLVTLQNELGDLINIMRAVRKE